MYRAANSHRMRGSAIDIRWIQTLIQAMLHWRKVLQCSDQLLEKETNQDDQVLRPSERPVLFEKKGVTKH